MNLVSIISPDDPRIEDYVSVRERDLTGRDGKFIVEGKVTLDIFLRQSRFEVVSLFLESGRLEPLAQLFQHVPPDVPIYTADQALMDQIAGFPIHRGILACGRKTEPTGLSSFLRSIPEASTLVLCVGLSNHDNVGAVFRNAAALGAQGVILDQESCDPLYRKSIRVSAGTALWLPFHHGGTAHDILNGLKEAGYDIWALTPGKDAMNLYQKPRPSKLCLVLGPEGPGLPQAIIDVAEPVVIPMSEGVDSLNVATSLAVALSWRLSGADGHGN